MRAVKYVPPPLKLTETWIFSREEMGTTFVPNILSGEMAIPLVPWYSHMGWYGDSTCTLLLHVGRWGLHFYWETLVQWDGAHARTLVFSCREKVDSTRTLMFSCGEKGASIRSKMFSCGEKGTSTRPWCLHAGKRGLQSYLDVLGGELERRVRVVGVRVAVHEQLVAGGRSSPVQLPDAAPRLSVKHTRSLPHACQSYTPSHCPMPANQTHQVTAPHLPIKHARSLSPVYPAGGVLTRAPMGASTILPIIKKEDIATKLCIHLPSPISRTLSKGIFEFLTGRPSMTSCSPNLGQNRGDWESSSQVQFLNIESFGFQQNIQIEHVCENIISDFENFEIRKQWLFFKILRNFLNKNRKYA